MRLALLVPLALAVFAPAALASSWTDRGPRFDAQAAQGQPTRFRVFDVSGGELVSALLRAPRESAPGLGVEIALPMPNGRLQRFRAWETNLLSAELRLRHPEIHAYDAVGVDRPEVSAHIDLTVLGVRAVIHTPEGTAYVDPLARGRSDAVMSYWAGDVREEGTFECRVEDRSAPVAAPSKPRASQGGQVRNLRLVMRQFRWKCASGLTACSNRITSFRRTNSRST